MPPRRLSSPPPRPRAALLFFAKLPVAGRVKTRLARAIGDRPAAALAEAFLRDGAERWGAFPGVAPVVAADAAGDAFWERTFPPPWRIEPQGEGDLGARLARALARELGLGFDGAVAIGSDHPALPAEGFARFLEGESAVWPARDGGFAAFFLRREDARLVAPEEGAPGIFDAIDWSTSRVLAQTMARADALGVRLARAPETFDVDEEGDLDLLGRTLASRDRSAPDFPRHTWEALRAIGRSVPA